MSDKKRYVVSYWHTGSDGNARVPGDVVELGEDEARQRLADGFVAEAPKAHAAKADAEKK